MIYDKEIEQTCYQVKNRNRRYNIQHISITMKKKQYPIWSIKLSHIVMVQNILSKVPL